MNYYLDKMGLLEVRNACTVSGMPKEVKDWIFEPKWFKKSPIQKIQ